MAGPFEDKMTVESLRVEVPKLAERVRSLEGTVVQLWDVVLAMAKGDRVEVLEQAQEVAKKKCTKKVE